MDWGTDELMGELDARASTGSRVHGLPRERKVPEVGRYLRYGKCAGAR
jgi:hypothetical protein